MTSRFKDIYRTLIEITYIILKKAPTKEDDERLRILVIDLSMFFLEAFGNLFVWLVIGYYSVFFYHMIRYCSWHDDFSADTISRFVKYEWIGIDPIAEQRQIEHERFKANHERLKELHRIAAEAYKKKPPTAK